MLALIYYDSDIACSVFLNYLFMFLKSDGFMPV